MGASFAVGCAQREHPLTDAEYALAVIDSGGQLRERPSVWTSRTVHHVAAPFAHTNTSHFFRQERPRI